MFLQEEFAQYGGAAGLRLIHGGDCGQNGILESTFEGLVTCPLQLQHEKWGVIKLVST